MIHATKTIAAVTAVLFVATSGDSIAQQPFPKRKVLGMQSKSRDFEQVVAKICDPGTAMLPDRQLKRSDIYMRLTERRFVRPAGKFEPSSYLGGKPYVFLTVPQAGFGRSLYGIYSDLGYDAEGILRQRNKQMVALVFRYAKDVRFSDERNGSGPLETGGFKKFVYAPTWLNSFQLFQRLASEKVPDDAPAVLYLAFDNDSDRDLARYFPAERRTHIRQLPYALLRIAGGPDWEYRQLLDSKMGMNSHFRGVGITENTLSPADNRAGVPEFVGPNRLLAELQDYAVIDLGKMAFEEVHD